MLVVSLPGNNLERQILTMVPTSLFVFLLLLFYLKFRYFVFCFPLWVFARVNI